MKDNFPSLPLSLWLLGWMLALSFEFVTAETVAPTSTSGLRYDLYANVPGSGLASLTANPAFPDNPSEGNQLWSQSFYGEAKSSASPDGGAGYGDRLSGFLIAPKTGAYDFWVGGEDAMALYLSAGTDSAAKVKIAWTDKANRPNAKTGLPEWLSNGASAARSSANGFSFNAGAPGVIQLTAGQLYYIELDHKANAGSAGTIAVGWTKPGDALKSSGPTEIISSDYLTPNLVSLPKVQLTHAQLASRFLGQATFGATPDDVAALSTALDAQPATALADWINAQYAKPVLPTDLSLTVFRTDCPPQYPVKGYRQSTHEAEAVRASLMISDNNHELRRKVAYALSQIFVVSDQGALIGAPEGMCDWNDLLFKDAFSDFHTILRDVTYHPAMAAYLSLNGNAKAGFYNAGSRPDENYAREVMQLFTIGLVKLNMDGTPVTDDKGATIATYDQNTITEMARVFTGLEFPKGMAEKLTYKDGVRGVIQHKGAVRYGVDVAVEKRHDTGEKHIFGETLPAGQTTFQDIDATLQILFNHPNTAPFLARSLIQHLVTSNPSPAYVRRVTETFVSSKGDMKAIVSAILLDPEAVDPTNALNPRYGKLREPWTRLTQTARAFNVQNQSDKPYFPVYTRALLPVLGEYPYAASSVFNFFLPTYQSPGVVSKVNATASDASMLVDPEFQIMNSNTALLMPNLLLDSVNGGQQGRAKKHPLVLDLAPQIKLAGDTSALVDNVDTLLTAGMMSDRTRSVIIGAVNALTPATDPAVLEERAKTAVYLTLISPDYAIQK